MREVFAEQRPTVVFHAAAYKHVGLMEANPVEAVRNNALATRVVAHVAGELGVARFVLVSTDKAVAPATVMGASKALAEFALEAAAARFPETRYAAVRFGNVLGSSGSVVPIFRRQIERGGPVTVTDERMTRYFMTIPEAVQLIIRTGSLGRASGRRAALPASWRRIGTARAGAEVFVLDMGEPVRILDLARAMIELSGLDPDRDIEIEFVGRRAGEKLHEELFNAYERARADGRREDPAGRARAARRRARSSRSSTRSACWCSRATRPAWPRRSPSCRRAAVAAGDPASAGRSGRAGARRRRVRAARTMRLRPSYTLEIHDARRRSRSRSRATFTQVGAIAAFAALRGIALLSLLVFAQARELRRLREWAGRAPERAADLEQRVSADAAARVQRTAPAPIAGARPCRPGARRSPRAGTRRPSHSRAAVGGPLPAQPATAQAARRDRRRAPAPAAPCQRRRGATPAPLRAHSRSPARRPRPGAAGHARTARPARMDRSPRHARHRAGAAPAGARRRAPQHPPGASRRPRRPARSRHRGWPRRRSDRPASAPHAPASARPWRTAAPAVAARSRRRAPAPATAAGVAASGPSASGAPAAAAPAAAPSAVQPPAPARRGSALARSAGPGRARGARPARRSARRARRLRGGRRRRVIAQGRRAARRRAARLARSRGAPAAAARRHARDEPRPLARAGDAARRRARCCVVVVVDRGGASTALKGSGSGDIDGDDVRRTPRSSEHARPTARTHHATSAGGEPGRRRDVDGAQRHERQPDSRTACRAKPSAGRLLAGDGAGRHAAGHQSGDGRRVRQRPSRRSAERRARDRRLSGAADGRDGGVAVCVGAGCRDRRARQGCGFAIAGFLDIPERSRQAARAGHHPRDRPRAVRRRGRRPARGRRRERRHRQARLGHGARERQPQAEARSATPRTGSRSCSAARSPSSRSGRDGSTDSSRGCASSACATSRSPTARSRSTRSSSAS